MINEVEYQGKEVQLNKPTKGDMKKCYVIYMTINLINNKKYIGQDVNNNPKYLGSGVLLKKAIKKYGRNKFKKNIIEICENLSELNEHEVFWIEKYGAVNSKEFYNVDFGGRSGGNTGPKKMPTRSRKIISKKIKKLWINIDYRNSVIENKIGCTHNVNTKLKISRTLKEKYKNEEIINPFKNKKHTIETKNKISLSRKNVCIGTDNPMSVFVVLLDKNFKFVKQYNTLTEASNETGIQISNISRALKLPLESKIRKNRWLTTEDYNNMIYGK